MDKYLNTCDDCGFKGPTPAFIDHQCHLVLRAQIATLTADNEALKVERDRLRTPQMYCSMKGECIGEFSWQEEADFYDEFGEVHEHMATHVVPWDLTKDIYKRMLASSVREMDRLSVLANTTEEPT